MKVGSLVVIKPFEVNIERLKGKGANVQWLPVRDEKTIYTIREIDSVMKGAALEEGIIGYDTVKQEILIRLKYIVEIQPPISSEEIAELVEESCCVESL